MATGDDAPSKLQIYPPSTELVSDFWRDKYEKDAKKYWDVFYKRNTNKFFKDRHYLHKEWGIYFENGSNSNDLTGGTNVMLEIGCGVGNTLFPLLETYPKLFVHACDFSPRAISLVKAHKDYTEKKVNAFVCDVTCEDLTSWVPVGSVDIATLVFVLSAISPSKMSQVLQNIKNVLRPNGYVLVRDYASGDLAQERLSNKFQKISENFYVRGDGTRAYYFAEGALLDLFMAEGFSCKSLQVHDKKVENRARDITMDRRWIQGVFCLDHASTTATSRRQACNITGFEEVDLSEGVASCMFGAPELQVMPIDVNGHILHIKNLSKEYQHSCKATGLMLWDSACVLATLLARNGSVLGSRTVLELGCGSSGICSMISAFTADLVVATDGDGNALALLSENIQSNKIRSDNLCIELLEWGCMEHIEAVRKLTSGRGFDVIIGTDVTYVAEAVPLLFKTAKALISGSVPGMPDPVLILCHIERQVNEVSIMTWALECGFVLEGKWPLDKAVIDQRSDPSTIITSLFPCGLEDAFGSINLVQLFCFKAI